MRHVTPVDWEAFAEKLSQKSQGCTPLVSRQSARRNLVGMLLELRPYEDIEVCHYYTDGYKTGDEGMAAYLRFQPLDEIDEYNAARFNRLMFSFDEGKTWLTFEEVMA